MNKEEQEAKLKGMFEFLKGLGISGISSFSSYEEWKATKSGKPMESMYSPKTLVPTESAPKPVKLTKLTGEASFATQHAMQEQRYFFDNLTPEEMAEYKTMFGETQ